MENLHDWKGFIGDYYAIDELVSLTQALIRIPSHVNYPGREKEAASFLAKYCEEEGLTVRTKLIESERANVIVTLKGSGDGRTLLLNGHLDTVPPGEMDFDPYAAELVDGYIQGRGEIGRASCRERV